MEIYMRSHNINSYIKNDVVQKTIHQTNFAKTIKWRHWYSGQTRIVKLNSLKHTSRYAQNQNIQGTKRFGGI